MYISRIQISLDDLIMNDTAKTKLAMLALLYCGVFVKNSKDKKEQTTSTQIVLKRLLHK